MALASPRLRRALAQALSSPLIRKGRALSAVPYSSSLQSSSQRPSSSSISSQNLSKSFLKTQVSWFRSSSLCASARPSYNDNEKISPDTILFEGCDYNHWLITMDFPKDPKPTPEEMVETYVQTLAKVVGSVEEAKKRMYACSTTTYNGFQAVMTEEMSEKFRGLPGVVFILPDSYIDPVNKEYGGDKYINGTIIPRPPPVQYGRQSRYVDRNRTRQDGSNFEPRQNQGPPRNNFGPNPNAPGDGRNYGAQQNYPQQGNFGPNPNVPGEGRNYGAPQNFPQQGNFGPNPTPQGGGRSFEARPNYATQQNYEPSPSGQVERRDPLPTGNRDYVPERQNYQGERRESMPSYQRDMPQAGRREYAPAENRDFRGDNRSFSTPSGGYGQGPSSSYGQSYPGHGGGAGPGYGSYPGRVEGQVYPQMEKRGDMQGEQQNFGPMGQVKNDQWR